MAKERRRSSVPSDDSVHHGRLRGASSASGASSVSDLEAAADKHAALTQRYRKIARRKNTRLIGQECVFTLAPMAVVIALVLVTAGLADRTGDSLVDLRTSLASQRVDEFMAPLFTIQDSMRYHTYVGNMAAPNLDDVGVLNDVIVPQLAHHSGLVAVYTAFSNRDVIKLHQEKDDVYALQYRVYGEPDTTITEFQWARDAPFASRTAGAPSSQPYDPFARSWYVAAQETYAAGEHAYTWQGPDLNSELSDLERFSVVLSQVFRLDWADGASHSVHRLKYKVEELNAQLAGVVDGDDDSYVALVNPEGVVVATSLPLAAQLASEGEDAERLRMVWEMEAFGVTEEMWHFDGADLRVKRGSRTIDFRRLATFNSEWMLVNSVAHRDLLSHSLRNSIDTIEALFTTVLVLMCLRLALSLYAVARLLRIHDTAKTSLYDLTLDAVLIVDERSSEVISFNESASALIPELVNGKPNLTELFNHSFTEHAVLSANSGRAFRHNAIEVSAFRLCDMFGSTITLVMHDMTTRDRLHKERARRANAEHVTKERTAFMANISHEMRNPLMGVCGWADMLQTTELSADQNMYVDNVLSCGQFALEQINHLLDASKLEAKRMEINEVVVDVRRLLEKCVAVVQPRLSAGVTAKIAFSPSMPSHVRTDPAHVRQILINLLSNAAKFTKKGEITLHVSPHAKSSLPDVSERDGSQAGASESGSNIDDEERLLLHFAVEDTGCGIPEDQIHSLFGRFTQVRGTRGGTGLGLAIAHDLALLLGGTMWIDSRVGEGSTFHFTVRAGEVLDDALRDDTPVPTTPTSPTPQREQTSRSLRVLVADDMDSNRRVLDVMLSKMGHDVTAVVDGSEALEEATATPYDLILLDFHMPIHSGAAVTRALRAQENGANVHTHIIALTGGDDAVETACRDAGMNDMLLKPVRRATLSACVHRVAKSLAE